MMGRVRHGRQSLWRFSIREMTPGRVPRSRVDRIRPAWYHRPSPLSRRRRPGHDHGPRNQAGTHPPHRPGLGGGQPDRGGGGGRVRDHHVRRSDPRGDGRLPDRASHQGGGSLRDRRGCACAAQSHAPGEFGADPRAGRHLRHRGRQRAHLQRVHRGRADRGGGRRAGRQARQPLLHLAERERRRPGSARGPHRADTGGDEPGVGGNRHRLHVRAASASRHAPRRPGARGTGGPDDHEPARAAHEPGRGDPPTGRGFRPLLAGADRARAAGTRPPPRPGGARRARDGRVEPGGNHHGVRSS